MLVLGSQMFYLEVIGGKFLLLQLLTMQRFEVCREKLVC